MYILFHQSRFILSPDPIEPRLRENLSNVTAATTATATSTATATTTRTYNLQLQQQLLLQLLLLQPLQPTTTTTTATTTILLLPLLLLLTTRVCRIAQPPVQWELHYVEYFEFFDYSCCFLAVFASSLRFSLNISFFLQLSCCLCGWPGRQLVRALGFLFLFGMLCMLDFCRHFCSYFFTCSILVRAFNMALAWVLPRRSMYDLGCPGFHPSVPSRSLFWTCPLHFVPWYFLRQLWSFDIFSGGVFTFLEVFVSDVIFFFCLSDEFIPSSWYCIFCNFSHELGSVLFYSFSHHYSVFVTFCFDVEQPWFYI